MHRSLVPVALVFAVVLSQTAGSSATVPPARRLPPCNEAQAALLLTRFLSTFNRGDLRRADRVFALPNRFRWFSVTATPGERIGAEAQDRSTLLSYLAARHAAGEQLALVSATFLEPKRGYLDFTYELTRTADDVSAPTPFGGKGALVCFGGAPAIAVWSMGAKGG